MKIKLKKLILNLDGEEIGGTGIDKKPLNVGMTIANMLLSPAKEDKSDPLKDYVLAQKFYSEKEIELDNADYEKIKSLVKKDKTYSSLITGQILVYFSELEKQ